jgi:electron transfer flavoprotein alpha subunit
LEKKEGHFFPKKVAYELLSKGRELADQLDQELTAVILGGDQIEGVDHLGDYGADSVLLCQSDLLTDYSTDGYTSVLCAVITQKQPAILLYGATPNGRDLAPRVAARLHLGLTADCTGLEINSERQLVQTRPGVWRKYHGLHHHTRHTRPQTATVRQMCFRR